MGQHFILHEVLGPFFEGAERKKLTLSSEKAKAETTRLLAFLAPLLGPDPSAYGLEGLGEEAAPASTGGGRTRARLLGTPLLDRRLPPSPRRAMGGLASAAPLEPKARASRAPRARPLASGAPLSALASRLLPRARALEALPPGERARSSRASRAPPRSSRALTRRLAPRAPGRRLRARPPALGSLTAPGRRGRGGRGEACFRARGVFPGPGLWGVVVPVYEKKGSLG